MERIIPAAGIGRRDAISEDEFAARPARPMAVGEDA